MPSSRPEQALRRGFALAILFAGLAACGERSQPSVLILTLDTTRADRLGCYGRADAGTPALDGLAERGLRFDSAHTTSPLTLPAHASLFTGRWPTHHGVRDNGAFRLAQEETTLAERFRSAGWSTAAVVAAYPLYRRFGLDQGFDEYLHPETAGTDTGLYAERPALEVVAEAVAWMARAEGPFFLWVHLFDPHWPYAAPEEFARRFPADPYQAEIARVDHAVGELLSAVPPGLLVAVVGDHGEALGERDEQTHGPLLYAGTTRIPMILAGAGVPEGEVISRSVGISDLYPTLLELAGIDPDERARESLLQGRSLLHPRGSHLLYQETRYPRRHCAWSELEAVIEGPWKYLEAPASGMEGELYDLAADPGEEVNVAREHPRRAEAMRVLLASLRGRESPTVSHTRPESGVLEDLGYMGGGAEPELAAEERLPHPGGRMEVFNSVLPAHLHIERGELEAADALLRHAEALDPGSVIASRERGLWHLARGRSDAGELPAARIELLRAAARFAGDPELQLEIAEVSRLLDDYPEALARMRHAAELFPSASYPASFTADLERVFTAAKLHALRLEEQGRIEEALALWAFLVEYAPGRAGPARQHARLESTRAD